MSPLIVNSLRCVLPLLCLPPGLRQTHPASDLLASGLTLPSFCAPESVCVEASPMPDEKMLREKARAAVQSGKLPSRPPDRTWGAAVSARPVPCANCR